MTAEAVATLLAAGVGAMTGGVALYRARAEKRRTEAETGGTVVSTAVDMAERLTNVASNLITPLQAQLSFAHDEIAKLRDRLVALEVRADRAEGLERECLEREQDLRREVDRLKTQMGGRRFGEPNYEP